MCRYTRYGIVIELLLLAFPAALPKLACALLRLYILPADPGHG